MFWKVNFIFLESNAGKWNSAFKSISPPESNDLTCMTLSKWYAVFVIKVVISYIEMALHGSKQINFEKSTLVLNGQYWLQHKIVYCIFTYLLTKYRRKYRYRYRNISSISYQYHIHLSLIHIWRCRRIERCRSRWSPYH